MRRPAAVTLALALAVSVTACGRVGTLEKPAPLWGEKAKARYLADKKAATAANTAKQDNGAPEALPRDPRDTDPNVGLTPPRGQPIPGQAQSPFGNPPAGALPDPFAHPQ